MELSGLLLLTFTPSESKFPTFTSLPSEARRPFLYSSALGNNNSHFPEESRSCLYENATDSPSGYPHWRNISSLYILGRDESVNAPALAPFVKNQNIKNFSNLQISNLKFSKTAGKRHTQIAIGMARPATIDRHTVGTEVPDKHELAIRSTARSPGIHFFH